VRRALAALLALFGWSAPAGAEPPQFASVDACRQYLVDHPTGPLAEAAFRCIVESELPAVADERPLTPQTDIY
jgi:hypothetical protein